MKKWTLVVEITCGMDDDGYEFQKSQIENFLTEGLSSQVYTKPITFRLMETIQAPYGPQHPSGVFITSGPSRTKP